MDMTDTDTTRQAMFASKSFIMSKKGKRVTETKKDVTGPA